MREKIAFERWRGSVWNLLLNVRGVTEAPLSHLRCQLSTRHALRVPFQGSPIHEKARIKKPPLKREGDQRSWWRDSAGIFCFCFRFHVRNPSVSLRLPAPFSREPIIPRGTAVRRWRGSFVKSFSICARFHRSTPQSSLRLASSAQGTPCGCPFRGAQFMRESK